MIRQALLFLAFVLLAGCSQLNHLDRAQQYFNEGATLDNRLKLGLLDTRRTDILGTLGPEADPLITLSPEFYYNLAYQELNEALEKHAVVPNDPQRRRPSAVRRVCRNTLQLRRQRQRACDDVIPSVQQLHALRKAHRVERTLIHHVDPGVGRRIRQGGQQIVVDLVSRLAHATHQGVLHRDRDRSPADVRSPSVDQLPEFLFAQVDQLVLVAGVATRRR